jgi:hypothetical protein
MKENKHKISVFNLLAGLIVFAFVTGYYISNVLKFNQVTADSNTLKKNLNGMIQKSDELRTEIEMMTTFNKIFTTASEKLNMKYDVNAVDLNRKITIKKSELE